MDLKVSARRGLAGPQLAARRLVRRGGGYLLVVFGIAAGAAVIAAIDGGSLAAQDRSLGRAVSSIDEKDRGVRAVWGGIPATGGPSFSAVDARAERSLTPVLGVRPERIMLLRETELGGALVDLGAIDDLGRWVHLDSGRLPRTCTPQRCEVVQVGGRGPLSHPRGLRIVRVGRGTMRSALPLGPLLTRVSSSSIFVRAERYHRPAAPPFLLAADVHALASARALSEFQRTYTWLVPLGPHSLHPWTVGGFGDRVARARSELDSGGEYFDVEAPVDEVDRAAHTARVGGRRLLLLGGAAAALLLAFTVLAAVAGRRDAQAIARRLTWLGARAWQIALLDAAEAAVAALVGVAVGWAAGIGLGIAAADRLGASASPILAHSAASTHGIVVALLVALTAAALLVISRRAPGMRLGGSTITIADVAGLGAVLAIVLAALRGATDVSAAAQGGTGTFLLLLPGLVVFAAAVAAARVAPPAAGGPPRLLAPALRVLERLVRRGPVGPRLAVLSLARSPGRAAIAVTFLVVSFALALYAADYRATLIQGQRAEAAYAVPRDVVVRENLNKLVPVLAVAPESGFRRFGDTTPVVRQSGDVPGLIGSEGFTALALPARTLPAIGGWRDDFSKASRDVLARRLAPTGDVTMRGVSIPRGARSLELPVRVRGSALQIDATIRTARGTFTSVKLGVARGRALLHAKLPFGAGGGLVVRLSLRGAGIYGAGANGGLGAQPRIEGTLRLDDFRADGARLATDYAAWVGRRGVRARGAVVRYLLAPESGNGVGVFRRGQPTDGRAIPALVSPGLAAAAGRDGLLPIEIEGTPLLVRVIGTADRFPTTHGDFVVADDGTLTTAMNTATPGSAVTNELWLEARGGGTARSLTRALARPPFTDLQVTSRTAVLDRLASDPLARGSLLGLVAAAATALGLGLLGLLLALVFDLRDERGELFDLEAQGAEPRTLLAHLRLRTALATGFGLAGGLAAGAILSALTVDLVRLTAGATEPEPPLQLVFDWSVIGLAVVAFAVVAAAFIAGLTRRGLGQAAEVGT
jgi:hypothetical protein